MPLPQAVATSSEGDIFNDPQLRDARIHSNEEVGQGHTEVHYCLFANQEY